MHECIDNRKTAHAGYVKQDGSDTEGSNIQSGRALGRRQRDGLDVHLYILSNRTEVATELASAKTQPASCVPLPSPSEEEHHATPSSRRIRPACKGLRPSD
eukprot:4845199-Pleurochrysis_carterae.AAC.1